MNSRIRKLLSWPLAFAALFVAIPPILFYFYPTSLWAVSDYESHGLADALNLAYRLSDLQIYTTFGLADHPGIPFYFMSWLALALAGFPVAYKDAGFFNVVIEHVETYHRIDIWLAALAGTAGIYVFARSAQSLANSRVVVIGLLLWLCSTPATLLMFETPSIESFAILINGLFFLALIRIAYNEDLSRSVTVLAAGVSAFAYLNKLAYINVSLALAFAGIMALVFRKTSLAVARQHCVLFTVTSLGIIVAVGSLMNGWGGFTMLLRFHRSVVLGSGMYGGGEHLIIDFNEVWKAVLAIFRDKAYSMLAALILGTALVAGGFVAAWKDPEKISLGIICIGAGTASAFSAAFVLKHYELHYTAGVSATLPASIVALYLLVRSWRFSLRIVVEAAAASLLVLMACQTLPRLLSDLNLRAQKTQQAAADLQEIYAFHATDPRPIAFLYKVPFSWFGEGFSLYLANVPRLTGEYRESRRELFNVSSAEPANREIGAYVVDKNYFPTADSVKASTNLALLEDKQVTFRNGDRLIELRTAFILSRRP